MGCVAPQTLQRKETSRQARLTNKAPPQAGQRSPSRGCGSGRLREEDKKPTASPYLTVESSGFFSPMAT
jgi:hypothetical protein